MLATIRGHVFLKAVACLNCDNTSAMLFWQENLNKKQWRQQAPILELRA